MSGCSNLTSGAGGLWGIRGARLGGVRRRRGRRVLGGLIGLGRAEFRLPLLIGLFGFAALSEVILNNAASLIVVLTVLSARRSSGHSRRELLVSARGVLLLAMYG
ncbi:hypothetical protein [Tenggerimyces flavus]|uniref:Uncharacterized protein n=1 Tax=Tenggerimyces flavus TaxID=1708749 RepID=A0ABV7YQQ8_9ACTN|nr:hypothetical protein [Tenggerimyces flavus]MBM7790368.1 hypothetical protein [Tenggerimyces flavus]